VKGFLFDENVPCKLTFAPSLPVESATALGKSASDTAVWQHARARQLVIVSKDTDFSNRIMVSAPPPWVVHLRIGNVRKREFHRFLQAVWPQIERLLPAHKLINVYLDRIEAVQ
jgi:predicted nuclease of predicted toxin-antitoxin system